MEIHHIWKYTIPGDAHRWDQSDLLLSMVVQTGDLSQPCPQRTPPLCHLKTTEPNKGIIKDIVKMSRDVCVCVCVWAVHQGDFKIER